MNTSKFALAFDAWRGTDSRGLVVVDDISVTEGLCTGRLTPSPPVVPPPVTPRGADELKKYFSICNPKICA